MVRKDSHANAARYSDQSLFGVQTIMDLTGLPTLVEWAKKNIGVAVFCALTTLAIYGVYSFIGGYATKFGETFAGSYSSFRSSVSNYSVIDILLHDYLNKYNANRIGVSRFHNNIHDLSNNAMFYASSESLVTSPGVAGDVGEVANLSASVFSPILPRLMDNKTVLIRTADLPLSPLRELSLHRGVKTTLYVPIRDLSDRLIAMISIAWMSEGDVPTGTEMDSMITILSEAAVRIGGYLSVKK